LLGAETVTVLLDEGRSLGIEDAIDYAVSDDKPPMSRGGLTRRETEVARLVAAGQSNRDLARSLHISIRTAESHVDHILTKLGLANRTQLAHWAHEHDLLPARP
jgi:DNA-binding NarL/FixJ family response regulator